LGEESLVQIITLLKSFPTIKLCYFFGSRSQNEEGPMSDYDFALYLDQTSAKEAFDIKALLVAKIGLILKTDQVDVVILNQSTPPELAYNIICSGRLIYEIEPYRIMIEPRILNEYFDFKISLQKNNLTKAK